MTGKNKYDLFLYGKLYAVNTEIKRSKSSKYYLGNKFSEVYFTSREMQCIKLLAQGKTLLEIAATLNLAKRTVEDYTYKMRKKLKCHTNKKMVTLIIRTLGKEWCKDIEV